MIRNKELEQYRRYKKQVLLFNGSALGLGLILMGFGIKSLWLDVDHLQAVRSELVDLQTQPTNQHQVEIDRASVPILALTPPNSEVLRWIQKHSAEAECDLAGMRPLRPQGIESSWMLSVRGTYHCIGMIVHAVEQSKHIVRVEDITIVPWRSGQHLNADIKLSVWFVT